MQGSNGLLRGPALICDSSGEHHIPSWGDLPALGLDKERGATRKTTSGGNDEVSFCHPPVAPALDKEA